MLDIQANVERWLAAGEKIALATVVSSWGSAPRGVGSKMAITANLAIAGSVSGGCIEGAVVEAAQTVLNEGKPQLLHFGVSDEKAWEVGLSCGGKISVWVEPLDVAWWQVIMAHRQAHPTQPITTITALEGTASGAKVVQDTEGKVLYSSLPIGETLPEKVFVDILQPRPHLIIVGGVHVAIPLRTFAEMVGFSVTLIDPRRTFATAERFPNLPIIHRYPDKALAQIGITPDTYITVLTHDPKIDDPALMTALPSVARYVGVLSSRPTHEKRLARLRTAGLEETHLARLHTPIGLNIGAKTPAEIALAIMAEIIAVRNATPNPQPLSPSQ